MMFLIKGDREKIKKHLDVFIKEAKDEYKKQEHKVKEIGLPMVPFDMGYVEDERGVIVWDTMNPPSVMMWYFKPLKKKMRKNLKKYFKEKAGIDVKVKIIKGMKVDN